jgi:phosphoribosylformylglycinamidine synthase
VKLTLVKPHLLNLKKNKLKFSITVSLKKDVLDPQGKIVEQTLHNMGMSSLKGIRQGKYFEININEKNENSAKEKINEMCKKLLVNLIIEDYTITKI